MPLYVQKAKHHALPLLRSFPQFAYLPGRGTWDAICRVFTHAQAVATLCDRWRYNASRRTEGEGARPLLYASCQLFLDLTQAFDKMPRSSLQQAFDRLKIPEDIAGILLQWHQDTQYILLYKGQTATIKILKE